MPFTASPLPRGSVAAQPSLLGAGLGLRPPHHEFVRKQRPDTAWFELHPENFMAGGVFGDDLYVIGEAYPLSFHAVGMSLGSAHGIDRGHLRKLATLISRHAPVLVSDHLSWSTSPSAHMPDLLPLPYTEEALALVSRNVANAQDGLRRQILVENPSTYFAFAHSSLTEAAFLAALVAETGCGVLLDINNIYVSARNAGRDPVAELVQFLDAIPSDAIGEVHLAGHAIVHDPRLPDLRVDDHGSAVCADVWAMYDAAIQWLGPKPTLIEWDTDIPAFNVLSSEAGKAQAVLDRASIMEARRAFVG